MFFENFLFNLNFQHTFKDNIYQHQQYLLQSKASRIVFFKVEIQNLNHKTIKISSIFLSRWKIYEKVCLHH
jgi:hypothetical protein